MGIDLSGKVIIVTGGAKGIGEGCVQKFIESGASVVSLDIDAKALEIQSRALAETGALLSTHVVDVSKEAQIKGAIDQVLSQFGRIDSLINCAGIQTYGGVIETTEETWDKTFNVNVKSMFLMAKHVAPTMIIQKRGSIVNISSVQSIVSQKTVVAYSASKGAINALTRASAIDLSAHGIRVNAILPGSVDTPMLRDAADLQKGHLTVDEVLAEWGSSHPLGRVAKSTEIGDLAVFLASDNSQFITGASIVIDGGLTVQVPVVLPGK